MPSEVIKLVGFQEAMHLMEVLNAHAAGRLVVVGDLRMWTLSGSSRSDVELQMYRPDNVDAEWF